jgi:hypothetical protein
MARGRELSVAFALTAVLACAREGVPSELIGRWTSDDPRYADRSLEIGAETIAFDSGGGMRSAYRMQGVELEVDAGTGTLYRLYYDAAGNPENELRVRVPNPGQLRLDNHSELWTRTGAPSAGG